MRRRLRAMCWSAVLIGTAGGAQAQQLGGEDKFSLRGRVVNAVTGQAVAGALVEVVGGARNAQFSGADGAFLFKDLDRGEYVVFAKKPGYFNDREAGQYRAGFDVPWVDTSRQSVPSDEEAVVKLTPEGVISGRVEDEKGRPLEGVNVQAEMWMVSNGTKRLQPWPGGSVQTDDEGDFRIAELPAGDFYLKFSEQGGSLVFREIPAQPKRRKTTEEEEDKQGYGTQYYPGVADIALASSVRVRAGVDTPIQQTLEPLRLFEVAGVVRGAPSGEAFSVMLTGAGTGEPRGKAQAFPKTGEFRIEGVPTGRYLLTAMAQDASAERFSRRPSPLVGQAIIEVSSDIAGLNLMLGHGTTIGVRMYESATKADDSGHHVRVDLQSTEFPQQTQQLLLPPPVTDVRAPRAFENVGPGTYAVEAWPEGWGYVASLRCAGTDLLKEDLRVGAGTSVAPIEVTLRNDGAHLNISAVENGKPVTARVIVYSEDYPKRSVQVMAWATSVADVANLAPGTYRLVATRGVRELEFRNPAAMARYLTQAQTVTLGPEARVNVQVEVQEETEP